MKTVLLARILAAIFFFYAMASYGSRQVAERDLVLCGMQSIDNENFAEHGLEFSLVQHQSYVAQETDRCMERMRYTVKPSFEPLTIARYRKDWWLF